MATSDFYDSISRLYDHIFPLSKVQSDLILKHLQNRETILDVGCATGSLAIALSQLQKKVYGIDLNEKMIAIAKNRAKAEASKAVFSVFDMTRLEERFPDNYFDGIICLGNTLVHLSSLETVEKWLQSASRLLKNDGILMIQIVNYDRICKFDIESLPVIDNEFVRFERNYNRKKDKQLIRFHTKLTDKSSGNEVANEIPLYPILSEQMFAFLKKAHFSLLNSYGSFKGSNYNVQSEAFITISKKSISSRCTR